MKFGKKKQNLKIWKFTEFEKMKFCNRQWCAADIAKPILILKQLRRLYSVILKPGYVHSRFIIQRVSYVKYKSNTFKF